MNNSLVVLNVSSLSNDDLIEEYGKLSQFYQQQKQQLDEYQQEVFVLKRNAELYEKREKYLTQELDSFAEAQQNAVDDKKRKFVAENEELKSRLIAIRTEKEELELELEQRLNEIKSLETKYQSNVELCTCKQSKYQSSDDEKYAEYTEQLEIEQMKLLNELNEVKQQLAETILTNKHNEMELENLRETLECVNQKLSSKTEELEEKNQIVDTLQENNVVMAAELMELKSGNLQKNEKGNSLFAEVDDQRQQMKQVLAFQKEEYQKMKREYHESQSKIRRLQRENADMRYELQQCVAMFKTGNANQIKALNDNIHYLTEESNRLKSKLNYTENKLVELAREKKVTWLESMLDYCKKETETLKQQLYTSRLQKCEAEEKCAKAEDRAAKWRLEALKSRCVIADREMILDMNHIKFGPADRVPVIVYDSITEDIADISADIPITKIDDTDASIQLVENNLTIHEIPDESRHISLDETATPPKSKMPRLDVEIRLDEVERSTVIVPPKLELDSIDQENNSLAAELSMPVDTCNVASDSSSFRELKVPVERQQLLSELAKASFNDLETGIKKENTVSRVKLRPRLVAKRIILKQENE